MPLLSRAEYPALERRKGKEKASGKIGLPFHSLFSPIRTGVGDLFPIYFLPPQHFTLSWHYYFAKIALSIGSQYFQHNIVESHHLWSYHRATFFPQEDHFLLISSQQYCQTNGSTAMALTPSHFFHDIYQITTCSCLQLLPVQSTSPRLVASR